MNGCHASGHVAQQAQMWLLFYPKMSLRIIAVAFHLRAPRFILSAEQCGVTVNQRMWLKIMVLLMICVCVCLKMCHTENKCAN